MSAPRTYGPAGHPLSWKTGLDWLFGRSAPSRPAHPGHVYRLDFVDEHDSVHHSCEFRAETDDRALWEAEVRRTSLKMELWCGARLVWKWDWLPAVPPFP